MAESPPPYPRRPPSSLELPSCDGEPMETWRHGAQMRVLLESLDYAWHGRTDYFAGGNMFLYFSETQSRRNDFPGPDVFVVLNTTWRERRSWVVWEEDGKAPDVVIELLSESTEKVDRGEKMRVYGKLLKVGEYFLFDPFSGVLEGYELDVLGGGNYVRKTPDPAGRVRCKQMGVWLGKVRSIVWGVEADWLRWIDDDGSVLPLPVETALHETARADAETARADAEAARADAEAARANEAAALAERLAAELAALKKR